MVRTRHRLAVVALAAASIALAAGARAEGASPADLLKERGLKRVGSLYVLPAEADVQKSWAKVRSLSASLQEARAIRAQVVDPKVVQETIRNLNDEINDLSSNVRSLDQQIRKIPRFASRMSRYSFENSDDREAHAMLSARREELANELHARQYYLNQLRNRPPDGRQKERADAEVQRRREAYRQAADELKGLVESTRSDYETLAKDAEVEQAIQALARQTKRKTTLGPSRDFQAAVKFVERLEAEQDTEGLKSVEAGAGPSRKPKGGAAGRRARK